MIEDPYKNHIIFQKYLVKNRIGKGSFGTVYSGIITQTHEKIAIKFEKREKGKNGTLETEACRLIYLQGPYIPKIICYGNNHTHNILVQELLGRSLENLFNLCNKKFSLKTVCVLGIEMIKRIEYIHNKYHIHRDIKPDNFMTGKDEKENKIYLIDFGLAKKYFSTSKQQHIKFSTGKSLTGTARYCSRNAHKGYEQSRRDDIESIGYVLLYFLLGNLPWQGLKVKEGEDQFKKIAEKKCNITFEELTKNTYHEFLLFFEHVDSLNFEDEPNYNYLISLFQSMIDKYCNMCFYDFDWKKNVIEHFSSEQGKNFLKNNYNNNSFGNCNFYEVSNNKSRDVSLFVNKNNESKNEKDDSNEDNDIRKDNNLFINEDNEDENIKIKNMKKMRSNSSMNIKRNKDYSQFFDKKKKSIFNNNNNINNDDSNKNNENIENIINNHDKNINHLYTNRKYHKKEKMKNKKNSNIEVYDINVEISKEKGNEETRITDNNNHHTIHNKNNSNTKYKNTIDDNINENKTPNKKKKRHNSMEEIELKENIKCCSLF